MVRGYKKVIYYMLNAIIPQCACVMYNIYPVRMRKG